MVKRRDFQKVAAQIHEFLLKLSDELECAELRDALNLTLLQLQRYYRSVRSRSMIIDQSINVSGSGFLSRSLRGMSPMTPFRDAPDKFIWKWVDLENVRSVGATLPARLDKEESAVPSVIRAAKQGDNNLLLQLTEKDPQSVLAQDALGRSAVVYATQFSCLDTLQLLLEQGADVNVTANDGSTAVHRACHNGNHEALQILIQYDADLTIQDVCGRAPIHWACTTKARECLQILIDRGVDVGVRDADGLSPSMWACRLDHIEHFDVLSSIQSMQSRPTDGEDDGFERDKARRTWMHWSVRKTEPLECLKTLLTEESALLRDEDRKSVLHVAAEQGSLPSVKVIVEIAGKRCLEQRDSCNRTPLILATMGGHGEVVNCLLSEGADLACVDNLGATAWDYASAKQLHYCMLIIASYIRQRAQEQNSVNSNRALNLVTDEELDMKQLQINPEGENVSNYIHLNDPRPPSSRPPVTPRTPRTPRRNGFLLHDRSEENQRNDEPTKHSGPPSQSRSSPAGRSGGPPQKRSPSAPMDEDEDTIADNGAELETSTGSKRMKSEIKQSESGRTPSETGSNASRIHRLPSHNTDSENHQMAINQNGHQPDSCPDDDASVSIDGMDVSDFDLDEKKQEATHFEVIDNDEDVPPSPRPPTTPRAGARSPERRTAGRQAYSGTKETGRKSDATRISPKAVSPPRESYYGDYEDNDRQHQFAYQENYPRNHLNSTDSESIPAGQDVSPDYNNSDLTVDDKTSALTPFHLSPLQPSGTQVKKKKKKRAQVYATNAPLHPPQSYAAPTHPQYPSPHSSTQSATIGNPTLSKSKHSVNQQYQERLYGNRQDLQEESEAHVDSWQRPLDEYYDDEMTSRGRWGQADKGRGKPRSQSESRGPKHQTHSGEIYGVPFQPRHQKSYPVNPASSRSHDDIHKPPVSPRRAASANDVSRAREKAPKKIKLPPAINDQRNSSAKRPASSPFSSLN